MLLRIGVAAFAAVVAMARAQDVPVLSIGVPDSLGQVEYKDSSLTVTRYKKWEDAYTDGVLSMVPPGKKLDLGVDLGIKAPPPAPPAPSPAPVEEKKVEHPPHKGIQVKNYDSWQAAYLDGYGFPAAGQKLPKKPEPKVDATAAAANASANATGADAPKPLLPPEDAGNDTLAGNDTSITEIPKVVKTGARRLLTEVPREMI